MQITPEIVRELLDYDPETGVMTWRERGRHHFKTDKSWTLWNGRYAGKRAGGVHTNIKTGYQRRHVALFDKLYREHRLAWMWMTDDPLPEEIDHANRDGTDNRWRNLRATTHKTNMRNMSKPFTNTSGVSGVCWDRGRGKWMAKSRHNGKHKFLGRFDEIDEAAMAVLEFRADNGFSPDHGMEPAKYRRESAE